LLIISEANGLSFRNCSFKFDISKTDYS